MPTVCVYTPYRPDVYDIPRRGLEQLLLAKVLIVHVLSIVLQVLHVSPEQKRNMKQCRMHIELEEGLT